MINFPNSPTQGQVFTSTTGLQYVYLDGVWRIVEAPQDIGKAEARNRIVNGAMQISQENGDALSATSASNIYYPADQWIALWSLSPGTAQAGRLVNVTPNGSQKAVWTPAITAKPSLGGGDYLLVGTKIEGNRMADFQWGATNAKQAVLRFGANVQLAGTYSITIQNNASDRSFIAPFTFAAGETGQWKQFSIVIPGDTTGTWLKDTGTGMTIYFVWARGATDLGVAGWQAGNKVGLVGQTNGAGTASQSFYIGDVGLYLDPLNTGIAPPWQMPDEAEELRACQRYWVMYPNYVVNDSSTFYTTPYLTEMRSTPAVSGGGTGFGVGAISAKSFALLQNARNVANIVVNARM